VLAVWSDEVRDLLRARALAERDRPPILLARPPNRGELALPELRTGLAGGQRGAARTDLLHDLRARRAIDELHDMLWEESRRAVRDGHRVGRLEHALAFGLIELHRPTAPAVLRRDRRAFLLGGVVSDLQRGRADPDVATRRLARLLGAEVRIVGVLVRLVGTGVLRLLADCHAAAAGVGTLPGAGGKQAGGWGRSGACGDRDQEAGRAEHPRFNARPLRSIQGPSPGGVMGAR